MDIYLIDQIMKGRYQQGDVLLDAGCGSGRNLFWFVQQRFEVYGIDANREAIHHLRQSHPSVAANQFGVAAVEQMPFDDATFHHVISSAVLHFANNEKHFWAMLTEMVRVLQPGGSLFIRMATNVGIEQQVIPMGQGIYHLPDGSTRFLLTRALLHQLLKQLPLTLAEPFKVVNVADQRCMCTLVLEKKLD